MLDINKSLEKFYALAPEVYLTVDSDEVGNRMEKINQKYNINTGALIIFVVVSDLSKEDIVDYLKREYALGETMSNKILEDLEKQIFQPLEHRLSFLNNNPNKDKKQLEEDKKTLKSIFEKRINKELSAHPVIINAVNLRIFNSLSNDISFKSDLEKSLLANEEVVTSKRFVYKGREMSASTSNWIKYFIEVNGSELFDNIVLSRFLVDSTNTKSLSGEERELLKKILNIYRNLKFFPESMPSDDGEGWEIIPTGIEKYDDKPAPRQQPFDNQEEPITIPEKEDKQNKVLPGQDLNIKKILELEKMLNKFAVGTLEYKVIQEELKKLQARNT